MRRLLQHRRTGQSTGQQDDVAVSCRIRLARNLAGVRFPDWNDEEGHFRVIDTVVGALAGSGGMEGMTLIGGRGQVPDPEVLESLHERSIVSQDLLDRGNGGALILDDAAGIGIMLNEEDHLRIQVIGRGMDLLSVWEAADRLDTRLEEHLEFAFSPRLGYLTACPSNVGTGLRASVMVHLLGLRLTDELDAVLRALSALRLAVRGLYGEGTEAAGHLFQVSNQGTLGQTERQVIETLMRQVRELIRQEHRARLRLLRDSPVLLHDCVARALALLRQARMMSSDEAVDYLSALRLGVQMRLLRNISVARLDAMMLDIQPIHLQEKLSITTTGSNERDMHRADWLRRKLAEVTPLF